MDVFLLAFGNSDTILRIHPHLNRKTGRALPSRPVSEKDYSIQRLLEEIQFFTARDCLGAAARPQLGINIADVTLYGWHGNN